MRKLFALIPLLALVTTAVLLVACGGDDDSDSRTPAAADEAATEASGQDEGSTEDGTSDAGDSEASEEEGGLDSLTSLRERASAFENETVRVAYRIEGESPDASGTFTGTLDFAQKPPKARFAISMEASEEELDGLPGEFIFIITEDTAYWCGEGECLKFTGGEAEEDIPLDIVDTLNVGNIVEEIAAQDDDVSIRKVGDRTVAGQRSDCYEVESPTQGSGTICVTKEHNIFSYLEGEFEGERVKFELVEFSQSVPDDLFEPPYPVTEFSSGTPESGD